MGAKIKQGNKTESVVNDALTEQPCQKLLREKTTIMFHT
jgi:hypothetical protein